jgi:hypothetical protein
LILGVIYLRIFLFINNNISGAYYQEVQYNIPFELCRYSLREFIYSVDNSTININNITNKIWIKGLEFFMKRIKKFKILAYKEFLERYQNELDIQKKKQIL